MSKIASRVPGRFLPRLVLPLLFAAALSSVVRGHEGDVRAGATYAQEVCAQCHAVREGSLLSPNPEAPPFDKIANAEGITGTALLVILQTPHNAMPDLLLPAQAKANVIASILSLNR